MIAQIQHKHLDNVLFFFFFFQNNYVFVETAHMYSSGSRKRVQGFWTQFLLSSNLADVHISHCLVHLSLPLCIISSPYYSGLIPFIRPLSSLSSPPHPPRLLSLTPVSSLPNFQFLSDHPAISVARRRSVSYKFDNILVRDYYLSAAVWSPPSGHCSRLEGVASDGGREGGRWGMGGKRGGGDEER